MKHNYYITGIAGTGKSTTANKLKELGFAVYDIDEVAGLCYWKHKLTKEEAEYHTGVGKDWIDAHDYICSEDKLKALLDQDPNQDTVIVGVCANQENFFNLFDKVFLLYCDEKTFIHRLNTRNEGNNFGKDASEQEQILSWYENFQDRVKNLGAISINTEAPLDEVVTQIQENMIKD